VTSCSVGGRSRGGRTVERETYSTDFRPTGLIPKRNHKKVCKPTSKYSEPRKFVETGAHR
jgi:hypothetical protein